ncbi:MAG: hypothetical protein RIA72_00185 [Sphingopyxis sp.]|uniref:hypothetical protein n=1 Tax=Sphingopyxis sp. TaxID=1908224 RepID=UPI0032EB269A
MSLATYLTIIPIMAASASAIEDEPVFVTSIEVAVDNLVSRDLTIARKYAYCLSSPRFPTVEETSAKIRKCNLRLPKTQSIELTKTLRRLHHIVQENAGSEASLIVVEKSNAQN